MFLRGPSAKTVFLSEFVWFSVLQLIRCQDCSFFKVDNKPALPRNQRLWQSIAGQRYTTVDQHDAFSYQVGICTSSSEDNQGNVAALQTDTLKGTKQSLGVYNLADFKEGRDWMILEYFGGDHYNNHCGHANRSTMIMISCQPGLKTGIFSIIEESNNPLSDNCYYLFELRIGSACVEGSGGLSAGSIFCLVFLSLVAVYLLFGFLYQRFVKGAQGREQIPCYSFWRNLGNLSVDGCSLVFRSTDGPREYRGISQDNLPENRQDLDRDSERDDQLLNM